MISILGSSFSVLYPLVLGVAAPLTLGALIYAYRRRGQGKKKPVATLFILRLLQDMPRVRRRFFPPLRFFFELLVLSLICLAAAGFYRDDDALHVTYVLDNSFSMQAAAGEKTVFAKTKDELVSDIQDLSAVSDVEIFVTSPVFRAVTEAPASPQTALKALAPVEPAYAPDSIDSALQRLAVEADPGKIKVFTDKTRADSAVSELEDRFMIKTVRSESRELENLAISDAATAEDPLAGNAAKLDVTVSSFASEPAQAELSVEGIYRGREAAGLQKITERLITIKAGLRQLESFTELPSGIAAYKVTLTPSRRQGLSDLDSLTQDNVAWVSSETKSAQTLLVSDLDEKALGLNLLRGAAVESIRPEEFGRLAAAGKLSQYRMFIFHRYVPRALPSGNLLFVIPDTTNSQFDLLPTRQNVEVTRWLPSHPLMSYLNVSILKFKRLSPLKVPGWASEIIMTSAGPAAFAGEREKRRIAVLGFELFPFEARRSPTLSIFTLNLFKWLSDLSASGNFFSTSSAIPIRPETASISYLSGEEIFNRARHDPAGEYRAERPGLLKVTGIDGKITYQAVNFFNSEESNLLSKTSIAIPATKPDADRQIKESDTWIKFLIYAACVLLLLELAYFLLSAVLSSRQKLREANA